ncbi:dihydroflavonol 4-reductase-like isoform X3 [Lotus japonicus]|nr:dihydroflavonol 4-reductase-like isoform X3 [Lotus japonicus]XP_057424784.1 dihydroflavonol 4-reductase-like isoform X3 [Lotus japonicus]
MPTKINTEAFVQTNIFDPSTKGTINLLKSCLKSNSVKRVYALSKHLTEEATFKFAKENIDITSIVAGPFFTANVPSSVKVLLSPLTGLS